MSIGSFLLTKENLELVGKSSWKFGRPQIVDAGMKYYDKHPDDVAQIVDNLAYMGLPNSGEALDEVLRELVVHYYEKLFVLTKRHEAYWIAKNRVDMGSSLDVYKEAQESGKSVFVGQSHFGATYLMSHVLAVSGFDVHAVGNFPEPVCSMLGANIDAMIERYPDIGKIKLVNLADSSSDPSVQMLRCLVSKKIVSNVYDENNQFCKQVSMLGKPLMGGTGMDLFLEKFDDERVTIVTPFLIRTGPDTFRYEVDRHYLAGKDLINSFYRSLEKRVREYYPQWYFIHEVHESLPV